MVGGGGLVVAGMVELAGEEGVALDVHERRREVEVALGQGLHRGAVAGRGHLLGVEHQVAALAGQVGVAVGARDGRAVAVVGAAVGVGHQQPRHAPVGLAPVQRRRGMVGHVPAEQPRVGLFHVVEVLAHEARVHPRDIEDGLSLGVEGGEGHAHKDVEPHHRRQREPGQHRQRDADDPHDAGTPPGLAALHLLHPELLPHRRLPQRTLWVRAA